jgi:hypothetical protein
MENNAEVDRKKVVFVYWTSYFLVKLITFSPDMDVCIGDVSRVGGYFLFTTRC